MLTTEHDLVPLRKRSRRAELLSRPDDGTPNATAVTNYLINDVASDSHCILLTNLWVRDSGSADPFTGTHGVSGEATRARGPPGTLTHVSVPIVSLCPRGFSSSMYWLLTGCWSQVPTFSVPDGVQEAGSGKCQKCQRFCVLFWSKQSQSPSRFEV